MYQRSHMLGQTVVEYLPRDAGDALLTYRELFDEDHLGAVSEPAGEMAQVSGGA